MLERFSSSSFNFFVKSFTLIFTSGWLVYCMHANAVPPDIGDGLNHFHLAQASWENPLLLLDHWGKPLFTLLASPFAQFGFNGLIYFQILTFLGSVLLGWKILTKLRVSPPIHWIFPFLLLVIYEFTYTILGGLTEPLFNFMLLLGVYLFLEKKYILFAIVLSFAPFLRSEGQLTILLGILLLAHAKQWKSLPFLLTGLLIYSTIGLFVFTDFWWYFTQNPYKAENNIYGSGEWSHYLNSYKNYLGNLGLFIFIAAVGRIVYLFITKQLIQNNAFPVLVFTYGMFIGVLAAHSYFWATGTHASMGLTRIATQGMPLFMLVNLLYAGQWISSSLLKFCAPFFLLLVIGFTAYLCRHKYFPTAHDSKSLVIHEAANYIKSRATEGKTIHYFHPLFIFEMEENPYMKSGHLRLYYSLGLDSDLLTTLKSGDLIVRDSWFGPQEMNLTLTDIADHPQIKLVKRFTAEEQVDDRYQEEEGVLIYRVQ